MTRMRQLSAVSVASLALFALLALASTVVFAQPIASAMPDNAVAKNYGGGWECAPGYRERSGACTAVNVPANAYPINASYGRGWECDRGYKAVGDTCSEITVPTNAYLNSFGDEWQCNRGFKEVGRACVAIDRAEEWVPCRRLLWIGLGM